VREEGGGRTASTGAKVLRARARDVARLAATVADAGAARGAAEAAGGGRAEAGVAGVGVLRALTRLRARRERSQEGCRRAREGREGEREGDARCGPSRRTSSTSWGQRRWGSRLRGGEEEGGRVRKGEASVSGSGEARTHARCGRPGRTARRGRGRGQLSFFGYDSEVEREEDARCSTGGCRRWGCETRKSEGQGSVLLEAVRDGRRGEARLASQQPCVRLCAGMMSRAKGESSVEARARKRAEEEREREGGRGGGGERHHQLHRPGQSGKVLNSLGPESHSASSPIDTP